MYKKATPNKSGPKIISLILGYPDVFAKKLYFIDNTTIALIFIKEIHFNEVYSYMILIVSFILILFILYDFQSKIHFIFFYLYCDRSFIFFFSFIRSLEVIHEIRFIC